MVRASRLAPRAMVNSALDDNIVDNSTIFTSTPKQYDLRNLKSAMKKHTTGLNEQSLYRAPQKRHRRVSFDEQLTLALIKRIPVAYKNEIWNTANELVTFRTKVLDCKELNLKMKLKSARARNHSRRVLLQYRTDIVSKKMAASRSIAMRCLINLKNVSAKSSEKTREVAIENANQLERELVSDQSYLNPTISSACFGQGQRWAFDYYLGSMIDTLCTVE